MGVTLKDFNETFTEELRDREFAAEFLRASLAEGTEAFFVALREVAKANGGMPKVASDSSLGRESLYKALSENGNPEFKTLQQVLESLGLRFSIQTAEPVGSMRA